MSDSNDSSTPPPRITSFTVSADGSSPSDSAQVELNAQVTLKWTVADADRVLLADPAKQAEQSIDVSAGLTATAVASQDVQNYSLVAVSGDAKSAPSTVMVSTHPAGTVVSEHAWVTQPPPPRVYTPRKVPNAPAIWPGVHAALATSRIVKYDGNPVSPLPLWMNGEADVDNTVPSICSASSLSANTASANSGWSWCRGRARSRHPREATTTTRCMCRAAAMIRTSM